VPWNTSGVYPRGAKSTMDEISTVPVFSISRYQISTSAFLILSSSRYDFTKVLKYFHRAPGNSAFRRGSGTKLESPQPQSGREHSGNLSSALSPALWASRAFVAFVNGS